MAAAIMSAVGGVLNAICNSAPVLQSLKYVMNPTKEIADLNKKKAILLAKRDNLSAMLTSELEEGRRPTSVVNNWLKDVEQILGEINMISDEVARGGSYNCCSRWDMGNTVSRLIKEIAVLEERESTFPRPPISLRESMIGTERPMKRLVGGSLKTIRDCVLKEDTRIIGVYGMGGVGKTATVTHVYNGLLTLPNLFDKVIWVNVPRDADVSELQQEIAKALDRESQGNSALGSRLSAEEDIIERSVLLFKALKLRKRTLLVLDDIWETISLESIGIPRPTKENGCKILLTTRLLEVCREMGCDEESIFKVGPLSEKEALELFMYKVGVQLSPDVKEIAESVAKECAGLPLAIVAIGGAMRQIDNISEWRVALRDLEGSSMGTLVFQCLRFSYDRLPSEEQRKCFLYCALYPRDWKITERTLIKEWIHSGLIEGRNSQDEFDQGQVVLNKLKAHCLLESVDIFDSLSQLDCEGVKMHDVIRDFTLKISSQCSLVMTGSKVRELPDEVKWVEELESASFMQTQLTEISISPRCPNLTILFLRYNSDLRSITGNFFLHMKHLRVLDLEGNPKIEFLPNSISELRNLQALCLRDCSSLMSLPSLANLQSLRRLDIASCGMLERVPSLANLLSLRILDLTQTGIQELPHGIELLVNLNFLSLLGIKKLREPIPAGLISPLPSRTTKWTQTIPSGLLSKLHSLQVLNLGNIHVDILYAVGSERGFAEGLLSLKNLFTLYVTFRFLSDFILYIGSPEFKGLDHFCIAIQPFSEAQFYDVIAPMPFNHPRTIVLCSIGNVPYDAWFLPQNTEAVYLNDFSDLTSLNKLEFFKAATKVRLVGIRSCAKIKYIWSSEEKEGGDLVAGLEEMEVKSCPNLYSLYKGIPSSTHCLRKLSIVNCNNLKNVFASPRLLLQLRNLEILSINFCSKMEEIIRAQTEEEGTETSGEERTDAASIITLPKLKYLLIAGVPNLKSIWKGEMVCDSLQSIKIYAQVKSIPIFRGEDQFPPPRLKVIGGVTTRWWDSLEWNYPSAKSFLQIFFKPMFTGGGAII